MAEGITKNRIGNSVVGMIDLLHIVYKILPLKLI
jgi:hypothetical protein